jgi:hypothetical protein
MNYRGYGREVLWCSSRVLTGAWRRGGTQQQTPLTKAAVRAAGNLSVWSAELHITVTSLQADSTGRRAGF